MGQSFSILLDVLSLAAGIFLIVKPESAFYLGRQNERATRPMPESWPKTSRIIGVLFILLSLVLFYFDIFA